MVSCSKVPPKKSKDESCHFPGKVDDAWPTKDHSTQSHVDQNNEQSSVEDKSTDKVLHRRWCQSLRLWQRLATGCKVYVRKCSLYLHRDRCTRSLRAKSCTKVHTALQRPSQQKSEEPDFSRRKWRLWTLHCQSLSESCSRNVKWQRPLQVSASERPKLMRKNIAAKRRKVKHKPTTETERPERKVK